MAAREGSPLVLGVGLGENFIASDQLALLPVTTRFIFLDEGDIAIVTAGQLQRAGGTDMIRVIIA